MSLLPCIVSRDLARHLREQERRAVLADAEEDLAERLQDDEAWVWENLGDLDQGAGVRDQAVLAVAKAVIAARPNNPALQLRTPQTGATRSQEADPGQDQQG